MTCVCQREHTDRQQMAETGVALHRDTRDAPCSNVHFPLRDRNLGRQQGYPWAKIGENIVSRCTNAVDRLTIRANLHVDVSYLRLAGSQMARIASWCEREEARACWQSTWKASSVLLAACYSGRENGLSHSFRSLIESCHTWLLPEGQKKGQRCSVPWLKWMSQNLSVLCWLEEQTLDTRGNSRQRLLASRRSKYLPEPSPHWDSRRPSPT